MSVYDVQLLRRETVAEGTMAFYFSKPSGFRHQAGQYVLLSLRDPPETDGEGNHRTFTIASAPHEPHLMFATRMRNTAFKRTLSVSPLGTTVGIEGPRGEMVLHDDSALPAVFIAGGIGITPFLAMIRHATQGHLPHQIYLFYSNRRPEDAAFLSELQQMDQNNWRCRLIAVMTEPEKSAQPWSGERGLIRMELIERYVAESARSIYYLAGPPGMVTAMLDMLKSAGVTEQALRYEEFYGY